MLCTSTRTSSPFAFSGVSSHQSARGLQPRHLCGARKGSSWRPRRPEKTRVLQTASTHPVSEVYDGGGAAPAGLLPALWLVKAGSLHSKDGHPLESEPLSFQVSQNRCPVNSYLILVAQVSQDQGLQVVSVDDQAVEEFAVSWKEEERQSSKRSFSGPRSPPVLGHHPAWTAAMLCPWRLCRNFS